MNGEVYLWPSAAEKKLRTAYQTELPAYLYGVTGVGKTSLIEHFLDKKPYQYFSALNTTPEDLDTGKISAPTVVLDDLYTIADIRLKDAYFQKIQELMERKDLWVVLISRAPFPAWLLSLRMKYSFVIIQEEDFCLTREQQDEYLERYGLQASDEQLARAWAVGRGNPMSLRVYVMENGDLEATMRTVWTYLESHVYDQWDTELQDFFMDVSIVKEFTVDLAAMITGNKHVEHMLAQGMETGNFFEKMGEKDGIWRCKDPMRWSMEQRLHKKRSPEQIRRLYYNAGLYYELEGDLPKALEMYKIYDDTESISRLLVANARKNAASGNYYELRKYYLELPEEIIRENPVLMMGMSLLQSILMNVEESERWYHELEEYQKRAEGSEAREARGRLITLDISLPHRGITGMTDLLRAAGVLLTDRKVRIPELSVTSNLPSMMNGGKDFCEWSRRDKELAGSIGKVVEFVLGKYGKGLVPLALAESFQEKGQDDYEVMALIQKGRMQADSGGKIEQVFVANGLLCRMYLIRQDLEEAIHVMTTFRERCEKEAPRLLDNIDAFLCRLHLYRGDTAEILAWMDTAPDENREFYILERFRYLTKARVYLQQGKYEAACNLLQQLLYYAREMKRTYIYIESTLLLAVTCYRMEREAWMSLLQEAVSEAESYHFVRVLTKEAGLWLPLLKKGTKEIRWKDSGFRRQVLEEGKRMAQMYPGYLRTKAEGEVTLSDTALKILRMQAEGDSMNKIAGQLGLAEVTVKYHCRETYRKLGVNGKAAAVNEARKRKLI